MSTERQEYSIANQLAAIKDYAQRHDFQIVRTYADEAKSGIDLAHRPALKQLLDDVSAHAIDYEAILVFDVSRWGRFQDIDESAYYEFHCKRAGVRVHYCAEPFSNSDSSMFATLLKAIKRAMAGEYLRELSAKVHAGQCRIAKEGFKQGGTAGYGLRRLMVSRDGSPKCILGHGERKSLSTDRVVYIPGPPEEVAIVRQIYSWYLDEDLTAPAIASRLNERNVPRDPPGKWQKHAVDAILNHPKYTGSVVFNRTTKRLRSCTTHNPSHLWIVTPNSFEPIVSREQFLAVQKRQKPISERSDEELLDDLRLVLRNKGKITQRTISATRGVPSPDVYWHRFGGLDKAYAAIGYKTRLSYFRASMLGHRGQELKRQATQDLCAVLRLAGRKVKLINRGLSISGFGTLGVETGQCVILKNGELRWEIRLRKALTQKKVVIVRVSPDHLQTLDLVLLDRAPIEKHTFRVSEESLKSCPQGTAERIAEAILSQAR
jgi:DNA invertase Pin-like site-specific DNA recombinase